MNLEKKLLYAYMAGIVDGEGSISIISVAKLKRHVPRLTISNTNRAMIDLFEQEFGGKVRKRIWKTSTARSNAKNWKPCFEWTLTAQMAASAVRLLYPYLRIKRRQAQLMLKLAKLKQTYRSVDRRWDRELNEQCLRVFEKLKIKCQALNRRGLNPSLSSQNEQPEKSKRS